MQNEELFEKINNLSVKDLLLYSKALRRINSMLAITAICFIILMLCYPVIFLLIFGTYAVFLLGKLSVSLDSTHKLIKLQLQKTQSS